MRESITFTTLSFAADFEVRYQDFFEQVLRNLVPPRDSKRAIFEVAPRFDGGRPDEMVIHKSLTDFIAVRKDCVDFVLQVVVRLLYQFGGQMQNRESAFYSHEPYQWVTEGPHADQEVIYLNPKNVWITQLGRKLVEGSFGDFIIDVVAALLDVLWFKSGIPNSRFGNDCLRLGW